MHLCPPHGGRALVRRRPPLLDQPGDPPLLLDRVAAGALRRARSALGLVARRVGGADGVL